MNKHADALIERVQHAIEPSKPLTREIPFYTAIEAKFDNLPLTFAATPSVSSDILHGNNVKMPIFTNGSSRVYVREIGFQAYFAKTVPLGNISSYIGRIANGAVFGASVFPFNWRWNFHTSITQRHYSYSGRCLASAAGRALAGNHLSSREPLIIEPMETFTFECELISFGMPSTQNCGSAIVSMILSGYREGG